MLLKDDKKKLVTLIMKSSKKGEDMNHPIMSEKVEEAPMKDGAEQDYEYGYDACCDDMIEAFKAGDSRKLKESLKSFMSMMMDEEKEF